MLEVRTTVGRIITFDGHVIERFINASLDTERIYIGLVTEVTLEKHRRRDFYIFSVKQGMTAITAQIDPEHYPDAVAMEEAIREAMRARG